MSSEVFDEEHAKIVALAALAEQRQRDYAQARREWAEAVGRPYARKSDPRPPPGEVDGVADE